MGKASNMKTGTKIKMGKRKKRERERREERLATRKHRCTERHDTTGRHQGNLRIRVQLENIKILLPDKKCWRRVRRRSPGNLSEAGPTSN